MRKSSRLIERAITESMKGVTRLGVPLLEDHFMAVNGCDLETMREHVVKAAEEWNRRSRLDWRTDYGEYTELLS